MNYPQQDSDASMLADAFQPGILRWLLPASTRARVHGQVQCRMVINSGAPVSLRGPFGISCPRRATGNSSRSVTWAMRSNSFGENGMEGLRAEGEYFDVSGLEVCGRKYLKFSILIFSRFCERGRGMKVEENLVDVWKIFVIFFPMKEIDKVEENCKLDGKFEYFGFIRSNF